MCLIVNDIVLDILNQIKLNVLCQKNLGELFRNP